jgi:hypothetical protein
LLSPEHAASTRRRGRSPRQSVAAGAGRDPLQMRLGVRDGLAADPDSCTEPTRRVVPPPELLAARRGRASAWLLASVPDSRPLQAICGDYGRSRNAREASVDSGLAGLFLRSVPSAPDAAPGGPSGLMHSRPAWRFVALSLCDASERGSTRPRRPRRPSGAAAGALLSSGVDAQRVGG